MDAQGDQDVGVQIGVHMSMEIRAEFVVPGDIGFDQSMPGTQSIALGLAHQGLGDGGDGGFFLNRPVRINIGDFGISEPQNIDGPVGVVNIAGNFSPHYFELFFIKADRQAAEAGQIGDQIACRVVGSAQRVRHRLVFHIEVCNNVFFFIQIEVSENCHIICSSLLSFLQYTIFNLPPTEIFKQQSPGKI